MSGRGNSVAKSLGAGECYSNCVCVCVCRVGVEEAEEVEEDEGLTGEEMKRGCMEHSRRIKKGSGEVGGMERRDMSDST